MNKAQTERIADTIISETMQDLILAFTGRYGDFPITEMSRFPEFRGKNFGPILKSADVLVQRGKLVKTQNPHDGIIYKKGPKFIKTASHGEQNMNDKTIERIAKKIVAEVKVDYTEKNSSQHNFKKGADTIRLYHNPSLNKPFTAVISGKDWDEPGSNFKTLIAFNDKGITSLRSGKEDSSLGKPAIFVNLPANLKQAVLKILSGKWDDEN